MRFSKVRLSPNPRKQVKMLGCITLFYLEAAVFVVLRDKKLILAIRFQGVCLVYICK